MIAPVRLWRNLTAAPHRPLFLGGAVQGLAALGWWLVVLLDRYILPMPGPAWAVPPLWAHTYLMIYGFFPFFILGFLFTTYPNWLDGKKVPRAAYVWAAILLMAGGLLFYVGLFVGRDVLLVAASLAAIGWAVALSALVRVLVQTPHPDKRHPLAITVALAFGWSGMLGYLLWLATESGEALLWARTAGIWLFLAPVFMTVSHRMIPFFSSRVLEQYKVVRPYGLLGFMLVCSAGHGMLELAGAPGVTWVFDLPMAASAFYLSARWGLARSFRVRLLAVLHLSFLWLGVSMAFYGAQSLVYFLSGGKHYELGLGPLHALSIGLFASMVLAMVSRVTLGHSGRPLVADGPTWTLFLAFQTVAILRVIADSGLFPGREAGYLYVAAAILWLACYGPWAVKYAPAYWRPRVDGKAG